MSELEYRRSRAKFVANLDLVSKTVIPFNYAILILVRNYFTKMFNYFLKIYRGATSVAILLRVVYSPFLLIENYGK